MIELPFPAKILWPNGRGHWAARNRAFQAHKQWAWAMGRAAGVHGYVQLDPAKPPEPRVRWSATFYPKTRHKIDRDNAAASLKAYQDGLAQAMGLNDSAFENPTIHFAEPVKHGKVVIVLGEG